jgi:hypothetical protein
MKNGKLEAVCIMAISRGEEERDVISQDAPTSCIQVPMVETAEASQRARNSGWARGLHIEAGFAAVAVMFGKGRFAVELYLALPGIIVFLIQFFPRVRRAMPTLQMESVRNSC